MPENPAEKIAELEEKLAYKEALVLELEAKIAELESKIGGNTEEMQKLSKEVSTLKSTIDTNERSAIVLSAVQSGKILPAQKSIYMKLSKTELNDELSKLPKKAVVLSKTQESILADEKTEAQKLAAYITAKLRE
jgi:uncharacterized coiled-coil protein SlyX